VTIAAFIVSILALITAGASVLYTRRQAVAAATTARIESHRHHKELTPEIDAGEIEDRGGWYRLRFQIEKSAPLAKVEAEMVETDGVSFRGGTNGVTPLQAGLPSRAEYLPEFASEHFDQLTTGSSLYWIIDLADNRSLNLQLRLTCHGLNHEKWTLYRSIPVPQPPSQVW
jgi:hypothetical protein